MITYLNGTFLEHEQATVAVDDRGMQFADGVYEVVLVHGGRYIDLDRHLVRLGRSASAIELELPYPLEEFHAMAEEILRRDGREEVALYLQVTRGAAPRDHRFPDGITPTVVAYLKDASFDPDALEQGVSVITEPDLRWLRCDIKSVALLPNVIARQHASRRGAREAILVRAGVGVTEASAANVWTVRNGSLVTAPESNWILSGIVRGVVLEMAQRESLPVAERFLSADELSYADEVFLTGTTSQVLPVVEIDGRTVGDGLVGPVTRRLQELYLDRLQQIAHLPAV